jgi:hypothetical protein
MRGLHLNLATLLPGYEPSTSLIGGWICPKLSGYNGKEEKISDPARNGNSIL